MTKLGIPNMMDSLDFVKKLWGSMGLPNAVAPTADLDELDKRIADLKAVEQWLQLNANMLRGTIQGLEVQRGTIATLKAFGSSIANVTPLGGGRPPAAPAQAPAPAPAEPATTPKRARKAAPRKTAGKAEPTLPAMETGLSPTAWWNMLSDQFTRVAQAAAASAAEATRSPGAKPSAPPSPSPAKAPRRGPRKK